MAVHVRSSQVLTGHDRLFHVMACHERANTHVGQYAGSFLLDNAKLNWKKNCPMLKKIGKINEKEFNYLSYNFHLMGWNLVQLLLHQL